MQDAQFTACKTGMRIRICIPIHHAGSEIVERKEQIIRELQQAYYTCILEFIL